jgi:hypothetical protein
MFLYFICVCVFFLHSCSLCISLWSVKLAWKVYLLGPYICNGSRPILYPTHCLSRLFPWLMAFRIRPYFYFHLMPRTMLRTSLLASYTPPCHLTEQNIYYGSGPYRASSRRQPARTGAVTYGSRGHCWEPLPGNNQ